MRLPWFIPLSLAVSLISGVIGASSLVSLPFYLNYGLTKERMIAAARTLNQMARALGELLAGLMQGLDVDSLHRILPRLLSQTPPPA
jgi:hypothetical protein